MNDHYMKKFLKNIIISSVLSIILMDIAVILLLCNAAAAVDRDELRLKAGLDLFPSLLTADLDITKKQGSDGFLRLVLIYTDNKSRALEMSRTLMALKKIRGIPIRVEISNDLTMSSFRGDPPAGIFLTQPLGNELNNVVKYAIDNHIILFSPFKGDVEKGVLGGLYISDRVLPFINKAAMKSSGIQIKQFFMRVSVIYEP